MNVLDWEILPKTGLGRLRFGMSPEDVDRLADVYGASSGVARDRISDNILLSTLHDLGGDLTVAEKEEIISLYQDEGPKDSISTEVRGVSTPLVLRYDNNCLVEILLDARSRQANFSGVNVFNVASIDLLKLFERLNGAPGRFRLTEVAFDQLACSMDSFCILGPDKRVSALTPTDERFLERSIILRESAYSPIGELPEFSSVSLLR